MSSIKKTKSTNFLISPEKILKLLTLSENPQNIVENLEKGILIFPENFSWNQFKSEKEFLSNRLICVWEIIFLNYFPTINKIVFPDSFEEQISSENLPSSIQEIVFGNSYKRRFLSLPNSVHTIRFGYATNYQRLKGYNSVLLSLPNLQKIMVCQTVKILLKSKDAVQIYQPLIDKGIKVELYF